MPVAGLQVATTPAPGCGYAGSLPVFLEFYVINARKIAKMSIENKEIKSLFKFLEENQSSLTENGANFIHSLKKYFTHNKTLTEKQQTALFEIKKYLNVGEPIRTTNNIN